VTKHNYKNKCHKCAKEYIALRPNDKWCSINCKDKARQATTKRKEWKKEYNSTGKPYISSRNWAKNNKEHVLQLNYDWKKRNPERSAQIAFKHKLKSEFNLTVEKYEQLMEKQHYSCAICKRHEKEFGRRLHLDVDHSTGELRGGLCYTCNRNLIGQHRDPELFKKAATYLEGPFTGVFVAEKHYKKKRKRKKTNAS
jgi:hypothetical protein